MQPYLPWLAFFVGAFATYWNVYTSERFHNYFFLIYKKFSVVAYSMLYGGIGIALFYMLKDNLLAVTESNVKLSVDATKAILSGLAAKGFADINFFNVRSKGDNVPIGLRSISKEVDKIFDNIFDSQSYKGMSDFMAKYYCDYKNADVQQFKVDLSNELFSHPNREKVTDFLASLSNSNMRDLDSILRTFGKKTFQNICRKIKP
jgi:hypothetical protein